MKMKSDVEQGWDFAANVMGADITAHMGNDYIAAVESSIRELEDNINNQTYRNLGLGQLQGYIFEEWEAGTFNVDAVAADSNDYASVLHSNEKDSVDILLNSGDKYSLKSYSKAKDTVNAQAKLNPETREPSYIGQKRVVPSDQLDEAKQIAHKQAIRNQTVRKDVAEAFSETETKLTDKIENRKGVSSKSATRKELDSMAQDSKNQDFRAEDYGISADNAIKSEYIVKQALKAGYTAAAVTIAIQLAPEIFKAIDYLIKNGAIDIQQVKNVGTKAISSASVGFLRGAVSSAIAIKCGTGALGEAFKDISPTLLGTVTAFTIETIKNSILVASGRISPKQMGEAFADSVIVSGGYLLGAHIGGVIGQTLGFEFPVLGYLLGSLIGTSFSVVYKITKRELISFCIDTGFTCFGLVEQDYELPEEVLNELGIETIPILRTEVETADIPVAHSTTANIDTAEYETINITVLQRGVIGVNKIGYIPVNHK